MRSAAAVAAALLLGAGLVASSDARACSVAPGRRVPTNLELAAGADVIVLAAITGERRAERPGVGVVLTKPTLLLKGESLPEWVELRGAYLATDARELGMVRPSDPRELRRPNPGALNFACERYVFAPGMRLVLFLKRDDTGRLTPIRSMFSRDSEDVPGPDGLWVKAVREYAGISAAPRREWRARLLERIAALRGAGDADSNAIAIDMEVELSGKYLPSLD